MGWDVRITTDATAELVSLREVKEHCRIDASFQDDDTYLATLITVAREMAEQFTRRSLATKTLELILDDFPCQDYIELPRGPVQSLTSIKYKDSAGSETTWAATNYILNADIWTPIVSLTYGNTWPSFTPYPTGAVRVVYVAGFTAANLPTPIHHAILMLAGELYENREASSPVDMKKLPWTVESLLNPYKIYTF